MVEVKVNVWKDKDGKDWIQVSIPFPYLKAVIEGSSRESVHASILSPKKETVPSKLSASSQATSLKEEAFYKFKVKCNYCGKKTEFYGGEQSIRYFECADCKVEAQKFGKLYVPSFTVLEKEELK
jgi:hypothetical protein